MGARWFRVRVDDELLDVEAESWALAFQVARELRPGAVVVSDTAGMGVTLKVGALVRVFPLRVLEQAPFNAKVVGYDMHRSKYQLGRHVYGDLYCDGGSWAFANEVVSVVEHKEDRS